MSFINRVYGIHARWLTKEDKHRRNTDIYEGWKANPVHGTLTQIGKLYGMTGENARKIVRQYERKERARQSWEARAFDPE